MVIELLPPVAVAAIEAVRTLILVDLNFFVRIPIRRLLGHQTFAILAAKVLIIVCVNTAGLSLKNRSKEQRTVLNLRGKVAVDQRRCRSCILRLRRSCAKAH